MMLPTGENLHKNLSLLPDEQVLHEYNLCYEILHGIYIDGELLIPGMLFEDTSNYNNHEQMETARKTWLKRLEIATGELLERSILS